MSETEARASDDATPDDAREDQVATHEHAAPEGDVPEDGPEDGPEDEPGEGAPEGAVDEAPEDPADEAPEDADEEPEPSWWHRSHPTFAGLVGFFAGVAYVIIVPGVYAALLGLLVSDATAQKLFPLVLLALVVPIAMLVPRKTRRFAQFMFLGIISTALVIAVTAALVIWVLIKIDG
jgi:hypothetical protein